MLFQKLGRFIQRRWAWLLGGWLLLLAGTWAISPPWDEIAQDREFAFLPPDAPSRRSQEIFARAFPEDHLESNIVLVVHRTDGRRGQLKHDLKLIEDVVEPGLRQIAEETGGFADAPTAGPLFGAESTAPKKKPSIIARLRTPNAPGMGTLLVSEDQQAMLVVVELTTELLDSSNWPIIERVEKLVERLRQQDRLSSGLDIALTGSAVIGRDHTEAQLQSAHATEALTVVLVIVLLVLIYRAPLLALIPLVTVVLAVQLSLHFLTLLAEAGYMTVFQGLQIYITILAYGAGVDYCLFLIARYREELEHGTPAPDAIARAVGGVGSALAASAATVMFGIGMMYFAQFGKFHQAGIAIPLALLVVLCANLTFTPSLLRLVGRWAFWPRHSMSRDVEKEPARNWWRRLLGGMAGQGWEKVGQFLLRRPATIWLATVGCMAPFVVVAALNYNRLNYDLIGNLPADSPSVIGTEVLERHFPPGMVGPANVLVVNPSIDFGSPSGREIVETMTARLREQKQELGLTDVRSLTAPLGITQAAEHPDWGIDVPKEVRHEAVEKLAREHYLTDLGERINVGTRLDVVLSHGPFSHVAMESLKRLEDAIRSSLPAGLQHSTSLSIAGATASVRDLAQVMQQDRQRIEALVLASVLVVLILLLRRAILSIYLLLTVLFSYYTTLGVAFVVFGLLDPQGFQGIDWKVAMFLFTILIAVGEDYNILLITRIDEEVKQHGPQHGITKAVARTGPIISSCGIIMAGTFGSLLGASLVEMKQLGFALAFGVLLDTFVVRPVLVPAFLILLRSGRVPMPIWLRKHEMPSETARPGDTSSLPGTNQSPSGNREAPK